MKTNFCPDLPEQLRAEPGQQGGAVVGHVKHRPHPLPLTHHAVNTVQPREVDAPLPGQQDMTGLHPPDRRQRSGQALTSKYLSECHLYALPVPGWTPFRPCCILWSAGNIAQRFWSFSHSSI